MIPRLYRSFSISTTLRNELLDTAKLLQSSSLNTLNQPKNFKIHTTKPTSPESYERTVYPTNYNKPQDETLENSDIPMIKITELSRDLTTGLTTATTSIADYFFGNTHHSHHVFYLNLTVLKAKRAAKVENKKFIDLKLIKLTSGNGGNGCVSFFKDNFKPMGPPDGGDGGNGGSIYLNVVDKNITSLHGLQKRYVAKGGQPGKGSQLDGKSGDDIIIDIPLGTIVRWIPDPQDFKKFVSQREGDALNDVFMEFDIDDRDFIQLNRGGYRPGEGWIFKEHDEEYFRDKDFFQDLNEKVTGYDEELLFEESYNDRFPIVGLDCNQVTQKPLLLLRGGKGGLGNMHFLTKEIKGPRFCKMGRPGITANFLLELKLIADLGLVGLPNAGKSSLLRAISKARPRVGHWEFTTLQPTVGTIFTRIDKDPFTVADIPGIIKGASQNKGIGLDFLRHIERSGGLVFVVSLESANSVDDLKILLEEVGPRRMKDKNVLVVATKADLSSEGTNFKVLRDYIEHNHSEWKIVPVCAPKGENVERCIKLMSEIAQTKKKP